uniref:Uncharacterized protein n=1 Tax=Rhizophagus irregularis (strain DAOM 181602 / DAOM 197198 / MUCL 43194) TaxID=747089 RepID=U9UBX3_RHIID
MVTYSSYFLFSLDDSYGSSEFELGIYFGNSLGSLEFGLEILDEYILVKRTGNENGKFIMRNRQQSSQPPPRFR